VTQKIHRLVRIDYQVRAASFAALFVTIGVHVWSRDYSGLAWALLALQFLVYPHLLFWRARRAAHSLKAEQGNLLLDSLLLGIWACALEFPAWIAFTLFLGTLLNNVMYRGVRGGLGALLAFSLGALGWGLVAGFKVSPDTNFWAAALCMLGLSVYVTGVGNIVFAQYRKLRATRCARARSTIGLSPRMRET